MTLYRVLYTDSWGERMGCRVDNKEIGEGMKQLYISRGYTDVVFDEFDPEELDKQDAVKKIEEAKTQAEVKEKSDTIRYTVFAIFVLTCLVGVLTNTLLFVFLGMAFIVVMARLILPFISQVFSEGLAIGVFLVVTGIIIATIIMSVID